MKILKESKKRTSADTRALRDTVSDIIDQVCTRGDEALKEYNLKFDQCSRDSLRVSPEEIRDAYSQLDSQELDDMKTALGNIQAFARPREKPCLNWRISAPCPASTWDTVSCLSDPAAVMCLAAVILCIPRP